MPALEESPSPTWTIARLRRHFGNIAAERLILRPRPGTAREEDLLKLNKHEGLCELVDGCLVEKAMGFQESLLSIVLGHYFQLYLAKNPLGLVVGPDAMLRLRPGLVRAPDISFFLWETLGGDEPPEDAIPDLYPDLAIEVISKGNTRKEMERKLEEYFESGARMVWLVYPKKRLIEVYRSPEEHQDYKNSDILELAELLPGFKLSLAELFSSHRRRRRKS